MTSWIFKRGYTFLFLLTIISCSKKEAELSRVINKENYKPRIVSIEIAQLIAENFSPKMFSGNQGNRLISPNKQVNSKSINKNELPIFSEVGKQNIDSRYIIYDSEGVAAMYVFSFANKLGHIYVSADSAMMPILAYIPKGGFNRDSLPAGAQKWLRTTVMQFEMVRKKKIDNIKQATACWNHYFKTLSPEAQKQIRDLQVKVNVINPDSDPCAVDPNYSNVITTTVAPLIPVEWGQRDSYNELIQGVTCSDYNGLPPTGCIATAMAQVIRYYQTPTVSHDFGTNYNFSSMPANYGNLNVRKLMIDVGNSIGMHYNCDGSNPGIEIWFAGTLLSSTSDAERIENSFKGEHFSYSNASHGMYDASSYLNVVADLNNNRPVILLGFSDWNSTLNVPTGTGHAWVCDGYQQSQMSYCLDGALSGTTYLYFHMNWGWQELWTTSNHNGWYAYNNWNIPEINKTYGYFNEYVINIAP